MLKKVKLWAVLDRNGKIISWRAGDGEEGMEIHRTKRLARGAAFKDEVVAQIVVAHYWRKP